MNISGHILLLFLSVFFTIPIQSSSTNETIEIEPQQYFEVTLPLPTDGVTPACSVSVLNHTFGNSSAGPSVSVEYAPPPETCEWSVAVLEFRGECKGEQHDRIAGVWIDGIEVLRTSTAQPTEEGIFWSVQKDVSRYSSVISQPNLTISVVMLENLVNDELTGVYHVNLSLLFYTGNAIRVPVSVVPEEPEAHMLNRELISVQNDEISNKLQIDQVIKSMYPYETPADLIIPISGAPDEAFWFKIENENDQFTKTVQISPKTYKLVLELYVSFHENDEFWYLNPPDSYIETNNLSTKKAHGAYREVLVTIDGMLVGTVNPIPVIFSGGINPLFWKPVVSMGAFDLLSYDIDLTPFLGLLLNNKNHSIGLQVADALSYWLIDANLHLWLDHAEVQAETKHYKVPSMEIELEYEFEQLNGEFEIESERNVKAKGWVIYSGGMVKTQITEETSFKNKIKIKDNGLRKQLDQKIKRKTKIKIEKGNMVEKYTIERTYPLKITNETQMVTFDDYKMITKVVQDRSESFSSGKSTVVVNQNMNCTGSTVMKGDSVLLGSTETHQNYAYKDGSGCYSRKVDVVDGGIVADESNSIC